VTRPDPNPVVGIVTALSPLVCRLVAPNPGPMTGPGTNSYVVGDLMEGPVLVIDPGPDDPDHLDRLSSVVGLELGAIALTHTHLDHWPGAPGLRNRTGAPVVAFDSRDGLVVQRKLGDGDLVAGGDGWTVTAVHTPGHASNHLCYRLEPDGWIFSGDHVMDGSTVVIRPPDGDLDVYLDQLRRIAGLYPVVIAPGHGNLIRDPIDRIASVIEHRELRTLHILGLLAGRGPSAAGELRPLAYEGLDQRLEAVAEAMTWATLRSLHSAGAVLVDDPDDPDGSYEAVASS